MLEQNEYGNNCNEKYDRCKDKLEAANSLLAEAKYQEAKAILETLINSETEASFIHLALGEIAVQLGSNQEAKDYFHKAIIVDPDDVQVTVAAKTNLGKLYLKEALADLYTLNKEAQLEELTSLIPDCARKPTPPMEAMLFSSWCLFPCTYGGSSYNNYRKTLTAGCRPCSGAS